MRVCWSNVTCQYSYEDGSDVPRDERIRLALIFGVTDNRDRKAPPPRPHVIEAIAVRDRVIPAPVAKPANLDEAIAALTKELEK